MKRGGANHSFLWALMAVAGIMLSSQCLLAQPAFIGIVDLYGVRKLNPEDIRKAVGIKAGDSIERTTFNKKEIVDRMLAVHGVKKADIAVICCYGQDAKWVLFAGIAEEKKDYFSFNPVPTDSIRLPSEIERTCRQFDSAVEAAVHMGDAGEDDSQGYMLTNNPAARAIQEKFIAYAANDLVMLKRVIRQSAAADQRAIAVEIIAYSKNNREIIEDLMYAVHDSDDDVRNNATRALAIKAAYANANPRSGIHIPATDFIQMLHSVIWTDRNKAAFVLVTLTQREDNLLLKRLKEQALPELIEMARWKDTGHSGSAYLVLGRIAGFSDEDINSQFYSENRNEFLEKVLAKIK